MSDKTGKDKSNTRKGASGFSYSFLIQGSHQIVNFIVSVVLARVLMPEEFGLVGMIMVFITLSRALIDGGFVSSLIRAKEVDDEDYSTVFFINLGSSLVMYALIFFCSPLVSSFYGEPVLTNIMRAFGLVVVINAFSIVQSAKLNRALDFKTQFKLLVPSLIISAGTSIWMAYNGYGVWSLIYKELIFALIATVQLWYYGKWKPSLVFNTSKLKYHFNFGYKLALTQIINTLFDNLYRVVIGLYYSATQLGFFTRARTFEQLPSGFFVTAFNRVAYPMLARVSHDQAKLKEMYGRLMKMAVFLITPILIYLGVVAEPLFRWMLTAKWLPAVPYFQLLLISGLFYPVHRYNINICNIKGRTDMVLRLSLFQNGLLLAGAFSAIWFGIYGLLYSLVVVNVIVTIINAYFSGKLIEYGLAEQARDLYPAFLIGIIAGGIAYMCDLYFFHGQADLLRIIFAGIIYMAFYLSLALVFRLNAMTDAKNLILKRN